ncbi:MAG: LysR substrate-binding domain-containing protein [Paracoccaceae bacterium]
MPALPPPLQTLRAFEATGRLLSMALAAAELNVTPGAVSRQIRTLEDDLGVRLFRRMTRSLALTEEGAALHQVVSRSLAELTREAERLRAKDTGTRFTLTTSVSFSRWLAPRLAGLMQQMPEVDVRLDVSDINVDLTGGRVDAAIRYGNGPYPGATCERLLDETIGPVCAPDYRARRGGIANPADLLACNLIREERVLHDDRRLPNWERWFATAGVTGHHRKGPTLSHGSLVIEAALRGEGVALGRSALVTDDISAGRLVSLFPDITLPAGRGYDLVYRDGEADDPRISALRNWLRSEILSISAGAISG